MRSTQPKDHPSLAGRSFGFHMYNHCRVRLVVGMFAVGRAAAAQGVAAAEHSLGVHIAVGLAAGVLDGHTVDFVQMWFDLEVGRLVGAWLGYMLLVVAGLVSEASKGPV
jgi:hypothetical protein